MWKLKFKNLRALDVLIATRKHKNTCLVINMWKLRFKILRALDVIIATKKAQKHLVSNKHVETEIQNPQSVRCAF